MTKIQAKHVLVFGIIVMVVFINTIVFAAEEGEIIGLDDNGVQVFSAKGNIVEVINVARKQKDGSKHISMKFSLVNGQPDGCAVDKVKKETHKEKKNTWEIDLCDETTLDLRVKNLATSLPVQEISVIWPGNTGTQTKKREVCFDLDKDVKWFNTYQQFHQQWPMDLTTKIEQLPFNSLQKDDTSELQHIVEGTFLGSNGFIIRLYDNSPLWYRIVPSVNGANPQMCISTSNSAPYNEANKESGYMSIKFTMYAGVNLKEAYKGMSNHLLGNEGGIPRPPKVPDAHMFNFPIWAIIPGKTLPDFPGPAELRTTKITDFAESLKANSQYHSIINLDTWWQLEKEYLVVEMQEKLRDIDHLSKGLNTANNLDYRLQMVVSPYVHSQSSFFKSKKEFLVEDAAVPGSPFVVRNGEKSSHGIVDFSNPDARSWFISQLRQFQKDYHIASFVFEPVTTTDAHLKFSHLDVENVPGLYSRVYAKMATKLADSDPGSKSLAGVKEARGNQDLSLFVHMNSRVSDWTDPRGIKSLIPTALALSLAGYSFIVPDLVGGRLPGPDSRATPDGELYTRWAQANALMPAMQFATPFWYYTNKTYSSAVKAAIKLHQEIVESHITSLANQRVNIDGSPIMRPMWWADPDDMKLYEKTIVDTQFLLGEDQNQLLVAPILEKGKTERQVYLPSGNWKQQNGGTETNTEVQSGPQLVTGNADLGHLLWYKREI